MTPDQLSAIRKRLDTAPRATLRTSLFGRLTDDARALLDEVERLTTELHASQAEVAELHADPLPAAAWVREVQQAAFKRGAEAMRKTVVAAFLDKAHYLSIDWADDVRDLPIPEDKK